MTNDNAREPAKAITATTETSFPEYDEKTDTWTTIKVLAEGRPNIIAAWVE